MTRLCVCAGVYVCASVCVCMYVCESVRASAGGGVRACTCVCVSVYVCVFVRALVRVSVCVLEYKSRYSESAWTH